MMAGVSFTDRLRAQGMFSPMASSGHEEQVFRENEQLKEQVIHPFRVLV